MTYPEIKSLLALKGIKSVEIARRAGVKPQTVSTVLTGRQRSRRVEMTIAKALRMPYKKLYPVAPGRVKLSK